MELPVYMQSCVHECDQTAAQIATKLLTLIQCLDTAICIEDGAVLLRNVQHVVYTHQRILAHKLNTEPPVGGHV